MQPPHPVISRRPAAAAPDRVHSSIAGPGGRSHPRGHAAFSLIEVLVATTLLVIIVITVGLVFRQSTMSWESGIRRADGNMLVRSVIGAIERDLMAMVDARHFPGSGLNAPMAIGAGAVRFVALLEGRDSEREPTLIEIVGGATVRRTARRLQYSGGSWTAGPAETTDLIHSQTGAAITPHLSFQWSPANFAAGDGRLPDWVRVEVELTHSEDFSGVSARSLGRDGRPNTRDDIETK